MGREYYLRARETLSVDVAVGRLQPVLYRRQDKSTWPAAVAEFADSGEERRFASSGPEGAQLDLMVRDGRRRPGLLASVRYRHDAGGERVCFGPGHH